MLERVRNWLAESLDTQDAGAELPARETALREKIDRKK